MCSLTESTAGVFSPPYILSVNTDVNRCVNIPESDAVGISENEEGKAMAKNIVVCCDGTGNEFGMEKSNVVKLH